MLEGFQAMARTPGATLVALSDRPAHRRPVPVAPCGFDEDAPHVTVARARDATALLRLAARVLGGDEPQVRHQRRRGCEAREVAQLGVVLMTALMTCTPRKAWSALTRGRRLQDSTRSTMSLG